MILRKQFLEILIIEVKEEEGREGSAGVRSKTVLFIYTLSQSCHVLFPCSNPFRVNWECVKGHNREFSARCRKCNECRNYRVRAVIARALWKFDRIEVKPKPVFLWTYGTNYEVQDIKKFRRAWRLFSQRMAMARIRLGKDYDPLFYVIEAGTTGRKLHIHQVQGSFVNHKYVRKIWGELTGIEKPNVNFECPKRCNRCNNWTGNKEGKKWVNKYKDRYCKGCGYYIGRKSNFEYLEPKSAFYYCMKYISKAKKNYYYQGRLLKIKLESAGQKIFCDIDLLKTGQCQEGIMKKRISGINRDELQFENSVQVNKVFYEESLAVDLYGKVKLFDYGAKFFNNVII